MPVVLVLLMALSADLHAGDPETTGKAQSINLALRQTADKLLRISGDSSSRIPAIENSAVNVFRVYLHRDFEYDQLPGILNSSLEQLGIADPYEVAVRNCENDILDLGFHKKQIVQDSIAPCAGREEPEGCHYIEVTFFPGDGNRSSIAATSIFLLLGLIVSAGAILKFRKDRNSSTQMTGEEWLIFGNSKVHAHRQSLEVNGSRSELTYREAKLLRLFVQHRNEVLERDVIMRQVWEDEGVQVSRSVDMFVSRLRKKLSNDPAISISAVHGVGYKMELANNSNE